jgi:hypothetical protein
MPCRKINDNFDARQYTSIKTRYRYRAGPELRDRIHGTDQLFGLLQDTHAVPQPPPGYAKVYTALGFASEDRGWLHYVFTEHGLKQKSPQWESPFHEKPPILSKKAAIPCNPN